MNKKLFLLLLCVFVVMIGFGVTLPVLPFFARQLHASVGVSRETMAIHISLLTSIYALSQLIFAPFWGQWSDRVGRRPLILLGIAGSAFTQLLFGFATSLGMLYLIRALAGFLSSAMLPAATSYVADVTTERDRSRGMAALGTAVSLGVIAGPALSGLTTREDLHFRFGVLDFEIGNFTPPFFLSAIPIFLILPVAIRWLPESLSIRSKSSSRAKPDFKLETLGSNLLFLLGLTLASQFGLTVFESTFALYALEKLSYGPVETGIAFMICGLVMAVFQIVVVSYLARSIRAFSQICLGFGLMGLGITLLLFTRNLFPVLASVGLLSLGMALITPNLAALVANRGGQHTGAVLGIQTAVNSLGQFGGTVAGGLLFAWQINAPYLFAGAFLIGVGILSSWQQKMTNYSN